MTTVDESLLAQLGVEVTATIGDELHAHCPMHKVRTGREDASPSWSINSETGQHLCFSCQYKGSLERLVADLVGLRNSDGMYDFDAAQDWLDGNRIVDPSVLRKRLDEAAGPKVRRQQGIRMDESRMALFSEPPAWALKERGLTEEACRAHGVLWDERKLCWITPIRDPYTSALWGWQEKSQVDRWFRNFPPGVLKRKALFGVERYDGGQMVVVESPLDAVRLTGAGVAGAVSTYGAKVSDEQFDMLREASPLVFAMDNPDVDDAGLASSLDLLRRSQEGHVPCFFFDYGSTLSKDPGDMSDEEILAGLAGKRSSVRGEAAVLPPLGELI